MLRYAYLVGGIPTPLKNDGVRQWEGWPPIYEMENKIHVWNQAGVAFQGRQVSQHGDGASGAAPTSAT